MPTESKYTRHPDARDAALSAATRLASDFALAVHVVRSEYERTIARDAGPRDSDHCWP